MICCGCIKDPHAVEGRAGGWKPWSALGQAILKEGKPLGQLWSLDILHHVRNQASLTWYFSFSKGSERMAICCMFLMPKCVREKVRGDTGDVGP